MEAPPGRFLTPPQRRIIGFALTFLAVLVTGVLLVASLLALGRLAGYFSGVLWPLATAGVLALILRPLLDVLDHRFKWGRLTAVIVIYSICIIVFTAILLLLLPPVVDQLLNFVAYVPNLWNRAVAYVAMNYPDWIEMARRQMENPTVKHIVDTLSTEARQLAAHALPSLRAAGVGVLGVFGFAAHLAIVPIYLFFFLLSRSAPTEGLGKHLGFLKKSVRDDVLFLINEFIAIVVSFFRGQLVIGLVMGVLYAVGFSLVGLRFGLVVGLALGVLNIIPYLGTITGLAVALPLAFLQPSGGWQLVGLVLLVAIAVQNIEGWYLTPKIMADRTGLHPVMIIVSVFFWGIAFGGLLGMLFAIPLSAFFVTLWRLLRKKYFTLEPGSV